MTWLFHCLRLSWRLLFFGFVFVVPLFLVAPICSFRTMQPHGLGAPRVGTVGALAQRTKYKKRHDTKNTKFKKYKIQNTKVLGALAQRNEQWIQKRGRETNAVLG